MVAARDDDRERLGERGRPPYLAGLIAGSAQLRRDIGNAVRVGISPRRYAGWEPSTRYRYDEQGRLTHTQPEPELDEWDQALVDEWLNWQAGVHTCGHHEDAVGAAYQASFTVCKACQALQKAQEQQSKQDEPARKAGQNPDYPRKWRVDLLSREELEQRTRQDSRSPLQKMQDAVAKLDQAPSTG